MVSFKIKFKIQLIFCSCNNLQKNVYIVCVLIDYGDKYACLMLCSNKQMSSALKINN